MFGCQSALTVVMLHLPLPAWHVVQDFKPVAKQLESAGLVSFQPHYLIWVCQYGAESEECKTQCIRNGAYCCPDPDDNIVEGYSGADVLMVRSSSHRLGGSTGNSLVSFWSMADHPQMTACCVCQAPRPLL